MEKILVVQTAFIGDAILTLPMLQALKQRDPGSSIDIVCIASSKEIFESSPAVDNVIVLEKRGKHKSILKVWRFGKELRKRGYSKVYSPHRSFRSSILVWFLNIRESYGFNNSALKFVYTNLINYNSSVHEVERNLSLIDYREDWRILPEINFTPEEEGLLMKKIGVEYLQGKYAVIAPASIWATKRYPVEYYVEIAEELLHKNYMVIIMGGKEDIELCNIIVKEFGGKKVISTAGKLSLKESFILLKKSEILISNDSAPTHLGVAADIPVLTVYCSTIPEFGFYPYNSKSFFISYNELKCKPCGIHGHQKCPIGTFECAHKIGNNNVKEKISEMINGK